MLLSVLGSDINGSQLYLPWNGPGTAWILSTEKNIRIPRFTHRPPPKLGVGLSDKQPIRPSCRIVSASFHRELLRPAKYHTRILQSMRLELSGKSRLARTPVSYPIWLDPPRWASRGSGAITWGLERDHRSWYYPTRMDKRFPLKRRDYQ